MSLTHNYENRVARVKETQYTEALETMAGNKPLTIVELRKAPATYAWLLDLAVPEAARYGISIRSGREGFELIVHAPGFLQAYTDLLERRDLYTSREKFMVAMGTLVGQCDSTRPYAESEALQWWISIGGCGCEKCGGPITPAEKLALEQVERDNEK